MMLIFPQCVCPNTSSSFFGASLLSPGVPNGLNAVEDCYGMAAKERRRGQAKHVTREVGHVTASSRKQEMGTWERQRASIPPPGRRLRMETRRVEAPFFPLASAQSPLLSLSLPRAYVKQINRIFAVAV